SYSHLDESTYPAGDVNSLMTPAIGANEVIHSPGPIALGIFADTGWNVSGLPVLSIGAQRVVEGNADTRAARFNVSLSRPVAYPVTFRYRTNSNTATSPTDFTALSGTGTIPAGTTSKTLNVTVRGDTIKESVERYYMRISSPVGATIGTAVATGGIIDDDPSGNPRLGIGNATIVEGDAGTRVARLTVALSKRPTGTVTVNWGTTGGSASPGTDYTAALGTITFQPGNTNRVIDIVIAPDITPEASETISVRLSGSTGAGIQRPVGVITITDDD
ncbi:MAG: hypothetical protein JJE46_15350, partial [Acidimicrobiia bacterium]|nr:hypothetical protein [Acidimicrobiia bacterium]